MRRQGTQHLHEVTRTAQRCRLSSNGPTPRRKETRPRRPSQGHGATTTHQWGLGGGGTVDRGQDSERSRGQQSQSKTAEETSRPLVQSTADETGGSRIEKEQTRDNQEAQSTGCPLAPDFDRPATEKTDEPDQKANDKRQGPISHDSILATFVSYPTGGQANRPEKTCRSTSSIALSPNRKGPLVGLPATAPTRYLHTPCVTYTHDLYAPCVTYTYGLYSPCTDGCVTSRTSSGSREPGTPDDHWNGNGFSPWASIEVPLRRQIQTDRRLELFRNRQLLPPLPRYRKHSLQNEYHYYSFTGIVVLVVKFYLM